MLNVNTMTLEDLQAALRAGGLTPNQAAAYIDFELFYYKDTRAAVVIATGISGAKKEVHVFMSTAGRLTAYFL